MNFLVKFTFNCINKRSLVSGKAGEIDITTEVDVDPKTLQESEELRQVIIGDMTQKTRQTILSLDITEVRLK
jgi:hypothetical protein